MVKRTKPIHHLTAVEFERMVQREDRCCDYLVASRWPNGVRCPRCGNSAVYRLSRGWHWQCEKCARDGYRFSHIAGTIFENTNKPLRDWFRVIRLMLTGESDMSALQIHRLMGFGSYKTAWYMCHRIRRALADWSLECRDR
jgi:transposase-like protein